MDEVLAGYYYHSASDRAVANEYDTNVGTYTRCVRDHYEPTTNALSE